MMRSFADRQARGKGVVPRLRGRRAVQRDAKSKAGGEDPPRSRARGARRNRAHFLHDCARTLPCADARGHPTRTRRPDTRQGRSCASGDGPTRRARTRRRAGWYAGILRHCRSTSRSVARPSCSMRCARSRHAWRGQRASRRRAGLRCGERLRGRLPANADRRGSDGPSGGHTDCINATVLLHAHQLLWRAITLLLENTNISRL